MSWSLESVIFTIDAVVARATEDAEFRRLALTDPNAAIEQIAGVPVPPGFKLSFVEGQGMSYTIGLPKLRTDGEMDDAELEGVAGGVAGVPGSKYPGGAFPAGGGSAPSGGYVSGGTLTRGPDGKMRVTGGTYVPPAGGGTSAGGGVPYRPKRY